MGVSTSTPVSDAFDTVEQGQLPIPEVRFLTSNQQFLRDMEQLRDQLQNTIKQDHIITILNHSPIKCRRDGHGHGHGSGQQNGTDTNGGGIGTNRQELWDFTYKVISVMDEPDSLQDLEDQLVSSGVDRSKAAAVMSKVQGRLLNISKSLIDVKESRHTRQHVMKKGPEPAAETVTVLDKAEELVNIFVDSGSIIFQNALATCRYFINFCTLYKCLGSIALEHVAIGSVQNCRTVHQVIRTCNKIVNGLDLYKDKCVKQRLSTISYSIHVIPSNSSSSPAPAAVAVAVPPTAPPTPRSDPQPQSHQQQQEPKQYLYYIVDQYGRKKTSNYFSLRKAENDLEKYGNSIRNVYEEYFETIKVHFTKQQRR